MQPFSKPKNLLNQSTNELSMKLKPINRSKWSSKKKTLLLSLFFIFIMTTGAIGFFGNKGESYKYKNIKLNRIDQGWISFYNNRQIFIPSDVKTLNDPAIAKLDLSGLNSKEKVYLSFNPKENTRIALAQFNQHFSFSPRKVEACTQDLQECSDVPVKTCEDATEKIGVIMFKEGNDTEVSYKNNCLLIQGQDLLRITDQFILEQLQ